MMKPQTSDEPTSSTGRVAEPDRRQSQSQNQSRSRRRFWKGALAIALVILAVQQTWRHGHDYVFPERFAVIEPGKLYRGAWQKDWPMRRIIRDYGIKTIVALAHPPDHPLAVQEKALADELGVRWIHIPIVDDRSQPQGASLGDQLDAAVAALDNPDNQPVFFHCHHGINRASMVQIAYRVKHDRWTLQEAIEEIDRQFGLVAVDRGPDYRYMERYYQERVLNATGAEKPAQTAHLPQDDPRSASQ